MVVDDEPDVTSVLKQGLETEGFTVSAYNDPEEALGKFNPGSYELVITDVGMPKLNGLELYSRIVKQDPRLKVGFLTGYEMHDQTYKDVHPESNIAFVIKKPVSINTLIERVKVELDGWRAAGK